MQFDRTPPKRDFSLPRTGSKVKPQLQNTPIPHKPDVMIFWDFSVTILVVKHEFQKIKGRIETCHIFFREGFKILIEDTKRKNSCPVFLQKPC